MGIRQAYETVKQFFREISEPVVNIDKLPEEWRRICLHALGGCEGARDFKYFNEGCVHGGRECYLRKTREDKSIETGMF